MTLFQKILLCLTVAFGSLPLGYGLYCVGACIYEQATSESSYPYSGFCPDSPTCYADEEGGAW